MWKQIPMMGMGTKSQTKSKISYVFFTRSNTVSTISYIILCANALLFLWQHTVCMWLIYNQFFSDDVEMVGKQIGRKHFTQDVHPFSDRATRAKIQREGSHSHFAPSTKMMKYHLLCLCYAVNVVFATGIFCGSYTIKLHINTYVSWIPMCFQNLQKQKVWSCPQNFRWWYYSMPQILCFRGYGHLSTLSIIIPLQCCLSINSRICVSKQGVTKDDTCILYCFLSFCF